MRQFILKLLAAVCIWICLLLSGIMVCLHYPAITQNLTKTTALVESAKFTKDQLINMADKTRQFVAGQTDINGLYNTIEEINKEANTKYKDLSGKEFANVEDTYTLDYNSVSHLNDVQVLFSNLRITFGISGGLAIIILIIITALYGLSEMGKTLARSSGILLLILIGIVIWAFIDFNQMFNWLHSLFFESGTWLFSTDSLLISMYPSEFWVGMGIICALCTFIFSLLMLIIGKILK